MQRRRGRDLEEALLGAAWAELTERGYAGFTLEAVAKRAGTSTPVIYRRWANKALMVEAALLHQSSTRVVDVPDTGTLRGDLIKMMQAANSCARGSWPARARRPRPSSRERSIEEKSRPPS
ncbi:helix-turn-helix domain-containing protein [Amycolatopsis cihanbeyliensis]|uniref:helix-turn-helix domain-containing protein n=1 Tax=Amycolatopsis cihanbeyliensis TaxID=1128664 RepID=UPI001FE87B86|nr:helix-turn-helix domain-containing protein [Amycolatopsis cihanbeyliensis]